MKLKKDSLLVIYIFLIIIALPNSILNAAEEDIPQTIIGKRMESTVCIGTVQKVTIDGQKDKVDMFVPCGSGVLIGIPNDPQKRIAIVTAKHVFESPELN